MRHEALPRQPPTLALCAGRRPAAFLLRLPAKRARLGGSLTLAVEDFWARHDVRLDPCMYVCMYVNTFVMLEKWKGREPRREPRESDLQHAKRGGVDSAPPTVIWGTELSGNLHWDSEIKT